MTEIHTNIRFLDRKCVIVISKEQLSEVYYEVCCEKEPEIIAESFHFAADMYSACYNGVFRQQNWDPNTGANT